MKKIKSIFVLLTLSSLISLGIHNNAIAELETVKSVDIEKYSGKWYEIASYPIVFQKDCMCTTAEYTPIDDYIQVFNKCYISKNSQEKGQYRQLLKITGKAFPVEGSNNSKLKVQFGLPFQGDYWVIDRDEQYSYAVVSDPSKNTLWILSRMPRMKSSTYQYILNKISEKGYDLSRLKKTLQHCK